MTGQDARSFRLTSEPNSIHAVQIQMATALRAKRKAELDALIASITTKASDDLPASLQNIDGVEPVDLDRLS